MNPISPLKRPWLYAPFRMAPRQSERLIGFIMKMLKIDLPTPDHAALSWRACGLPVWNLARTGTNELQLNINSAELILRRAGDWLFEKTSRDKPRLAQVAY
jgi:hypothetical protein